MKLSQLGVAIAAGAIALGVTILTAPVSHAEAESTIKSDCKAAGGTYNSSVGGDGNRYSSCCYKDINGSDTCDGYVNGTYAQTCGDDGCYSTMAPPNNGSPSHRPAHLPTAPIAPPEAVP